MPDYIFLAESSKVLGKFVIAVEPFDYDHHAIKRGHELAEETAASVIVCRVIDPAAESVTQRTIAASPGQKGE